MPEVPSDFPVKVLGPKDPAKDKVTCGHCGRSWDDAVVTDWTPAPSARCPFEYFHDYDEDEDEDENEEDDTVTYKIVRKFRDEHEDEELVAGLTLEQARAHCRDKNTSSSTATSASAQAITEKMGPWFDCYEEE